MQLYSPSGYLSSAPCNCQGKLLIMAYFSQSFFFKMAAMVRRPYSASDFLMPGPIAWKVQEHSQTGEGSFIGDGSRPVAHKPVASLPWDFWIGKIWGNWPLWSDCLERFCQDVSVIFPHSGKGNPKQFILEIPERCLEHVSTLEVHLHETYLCKTQKQTNWSLVGSVEVLIGHIEMLWHCKQYWFQITSMVDIRVACYRTWVRLLSVPLCALSCEFLQAPTSVFHLSAAHPGSV